MGVPCYWVDGKSYFKCEKCGNETLSTKLRWFDGGGYCPECHLSAVTPLIAEFNEKYEEGECDWTSDIVCPYCGQNNDTSDAFDGGEPSGWTCQRCSKDFDLEVEYDITYKSTRRERDTESTAPHSVAEAETERNDSNGTSNNNV